MEGGEKEGAEIAVATLATMIEMTGANLIAGRMLGAATDDLRKRVFKQRRSCCTIRTIIRKAADERAALHCMVEH